MSIKRHYKACKINGFCINITSNVEVDEAPCNVQEGCSKLQCAPSLSPMVGMGQKGLSR